VIIRQALPTDFLATETLERETFWNLYEPGGAKEHFLIHQLRKTPAYIPELDLVAEIDGEIVGHAMGSHSKVVSDDGTEHPVLTFGPFAVKKGIQRGGIGRAIIEEMFRIATDMGFGAFVTAGDWEIYSRYGFEPAEKFDVHMFGYYGDWLHVRELRPGAMAEISGEYSDALLPLVDEEAQAAFDANLPALPAATDADREFWAAEAVRFEGTDRPARDWASDEGAEAIENL
jgi:predicted N-acetyltransferase YhbS